MAIKLSDHFTYKRLLKFTFPSIIMMIFMSIYGVVDGLFVSNFIGKTSFTALNFIYPVIMLFSAAGFMFGSGGSALISKTLGEGNKKKANEIFSMVVYVTILTAIVLAVIGIFTLRPIAILLGAEGKMLEEAIKYGTILLISLPAFMLQVEFQTFFVTAEKPKMGLIITLFAGISNIILDALLIAVFKLGISGAAIATATSQVIGGIVPILYFIFKKNNLLKICKFTFDGKALFKICTNGASELLNNIAMSFVGVLYNVQLLKYAGENGVAAYGILMYICMVFNSIFIGFAIGTAPVIGYHYGAKNTKELKSLLKKCLYIILFSSLLMFVLSEVLGGIFAELFVGYDEELCNLTKRGFIIYSFIFLFMGFAIFFSSFFTSLNDGPISAFISMLRTLVFQVITVIVFPLVIDIDGVWLSAVVAEMLAVVVGVLFLIIKRKKYNY